MILNSALTDMINLILQKYLGAKGELKLLDSVSGGSINNCYQIGFASRRFFLKLNNVQIYAGMFSSEASALKRLAETGKIAVPAVVNHGVAGDEQFLILEWVERGVNSFEAQSALGFQLAELHKCSNNYYGLDRDNYMGSLVQKNAVSNSISQFFVEQRLMVQVEIASRKGFIDKNIGKQFDVLFKKAGDIIPNEPPALVHGDLWSGNYMISSDGIPFLIDPAIAYSHREVDIAMTQLFGGFDSGFYTSYQESFPLEKDWEKRVYFWNLYPLLVHLNLFGRGYLQDIQSCLKHWV